MASVAPSIEQAAIRTFIRDHFLGIERSLRSLEKQSADRYSDAASFAKALAACGCAADWTTDDAAQWWDEHKGDDHLVERETEPLEMTIDLNLNETIDG